MRPARTSPEGSRGERQSLLNLGAQLTRDPRHETKESRSRSRSGCASRRRRRSRMHRTVPADVKAVPSAPVDEL